MTCGFWIFVVFYVFSSSVGTSLDFSSGSLSVSEIGTRTSSRSDSSGSPPKAFEGEKCAKLKKKKLAYYKGCVVGNLFKDSLVMMHEKSSFPQRGRPEVWHKRNILLRCSVEHLYFTSWKKKSFAGTFRYIFVEQLFWLRKISNTKTQLAWFVTLHAQEVNTVPPFTTRFSVDRA